VQGQHAGERIKEGHGIVSGIRVWCDYKGRQGGTCVLACWVRGIGHLLFFIWKDFKPVYGQQRRSVPERFDTSLRWLQPQVVSAPAPNSFWENKQFTLLGQNPVYGWAASPGTPKLTGRRMQVHSAYCNFIAMQKNRRTSTCLVKIKAWSFA
jgi:hypothetical protein